MRTRSASRRVKIDSSSGTDVAALFILLANNIGRGRYSDHTACGTHGSRCANGFVWLGHLLDSCPLMSCPRQRMIATMRCMPSRLDIVTFHDTPTPPGKSPWVPGVGPQVGGGRRSRPHVATVCRVGIPDPDRVGLGCPRPRPRRIDIGLGPGGQVDHRHKLTVADPKDESACVPGLEAVGFRLRAREPWWSARAEVAR